MKVTVMEVNGVHEIDVMYCICGWDVNKYEQMITAGFFPVTVDSPRTVFSLQALSFFRTLNATAETSVYHYEELLHRIMEPDFPDRLPVSFLPSAVLVTLADTHAENV